MSHKADVCAFILIRFQEFLNFPYEFINDPLSIQ